MHIINRTQITMLAVMVVVLLVLVAVGYEYNYRMEAEKQQSRQQLAAGLMETSDHLTQLLKSNK